MTETVYLDPQGKKLNPNVPNVVGGNQWPRRSFLKEDVRQIAGVTTKQVTVPDYDPETQARPVQGNDGEYAQPVDLPLEQAQQNKKRSIDRLKQEKQLEGFTYDGMTFQCDEVAIARINATWNFAQVDSNYTQPFILKDNTTITLTNAQCVGLGYACGQFVAGITFTARQLKDAVLAATTVADVRAVTWPE